MSLKLHATAGDATAGGAVMAKKRSSLCEALYDAGVKAARKEFSTGMRATNPIKLHGDLAHLREYWQEGYCDGCGEFEELTGGPLAI